MPDWAAAPVDAYKPWGRTNAWQKYFVNSTAGCYFHCEYEIWTRDRLIQDCSFCWPENVLGLGTV